MKKWIYLLTLVILLLIPARGPVEAIDSGQWSYALLDDDSAKITAYNGWDTNIVIPSSLDGHPVSVIGERVFYESSLTSVDIPEGIIAIGDDAFNRCRNLASVTLPKGLKYIADGAFYDTALTAIEIPEDVTMIGFLAFSSCENLKSVTFPESLTYMDEDTFHDTNLTSANVIAGSYAETWAQQNNIPYSYYLVGQEITEEEYNSGWQTLVGHEVYNGYLN